MNPFNRITLGVCYYPEHWDRKLWEPDLVRMKENGIEVIRIAEFCWSLFENREGEYSFELFDSFLSLCVKHDMKVIFCTPTATPPAWLTHAYPEVLNADLNGVPYRHGLRRHYNYNSPVYLDLTAKIVHAVGAHYGDHSQIIGWQIDNELNCETNRFHSEADHTAFRAYMKDKYKTLDNLNDKMGSIVWSQTYTDWDQLYLSRHTTNDEFNPHILFEEAQFVSHSTLRYCLLQSDILRQYVGERFITTNGIFGRVDYIRMMDESLDYLTYDSYPNFAMDMTQTKDDGDDIKDRHSSQSLSITRAYSPAFGIMEQQSGANGWTGRMEAPMPRPGQMRLWTMQSLAHGADFISYFRWRTAPVGTEIYWHGILDYDNAPNRRLKEVKQIHQDVQALQCLASGRYQAKVAVIRDTLNEWDKELDRWHGRVEEVSQEGIFRACQHTHTPLDYVYLNPRTPLESLTQYDLLIYPHATVFVAWQKELLESYVALGGKLVFGARTGYKDQFGRCPMRQLAGLAGDMCGARVKDYTFIGPMDQDGAALWQGQVLDAPIFNDVLEAIADDAVIEATYTANYYQGEPAMISRAIGKGRAYYFGAAFSELAARQMLERFALASPYADWVAPSQSIELALRQKSGENYCFLLNYMRTPQKAAVHIPSVDLITGQHVSGDITLPPFGVMVLKKSR